MSIARKYLALSDEALLTDAKELISEMLRPGLDQLITNPQYGLRARLIAMHNRIAAIAVQSVTLPEVADVQEGVEYTDGTDVFTGIFVSPAVGDVEEGVTYGADEEFTGTFVVPKEGQVENGVGYGAFADETYEFTGTFGA